MKIGTHMRSSREIHAANTGNRPGAIFGIAIAIPSMLVSVSIIVSSGVSIMYRASLLFIATAAISSLHAETTPLRQPLPTPQNTPTDARQLLVDYDGILTQDGFIAQDRNDMSTALTSNGNLHDIVIQFFKDRDQAANFSANLFNDRVRLRRDIGYIPTPLFRSPKAQGLNIDASNYIKAFDARSSSDTAVTNDINGMRTAVAANDTAAITSNANAFFMDRHNRAQARADEAAAIAALKRDLRFHLKTSIHKPGHTSLSDHVKRYLDDRTLWLNDGQLVATDRNNLRASLASPSLESVVLTFLTDHHHVFEDSKQLSLDRDIMRLDVRYKLPRRAQNFFGSLVGQGSSKEDAIETEDIDQDVSSDNIGEK